MYERWLAAARRTWRVRLGLAPEWGARACKTNLESHKIRWWHCFATAPPTASPQLRPLAQLRRSTSRCTMFHSLDLLGINVKGGMHDMLSCLEMIGIDARVGLWRSIIMPTGVPSPVSITDLPAEILTLIFSHLANDGLGQIQGSTEVAHVLCGSYCRLLTASALDRNPASHEMAQTIRRPIHDAARDVAAAACVSTAWSSASQSWSTRRNSGDHDRALCRTLFPTFLLEMRKEYENLSAVVDGGADKFSAVQRGDDLLERKLRGLAALAGIDATTLRKRWAWHWEPDASEVLLGHGSFVAAPHAERRGSTALDFYELFLRTTQGDIRATLGGDDHAGGGDDAQPAGHRLMLDVPTEYRGVSKLEGAFNSLPLVLRSQMRACGLVQTASQAAEGITPVFCHEGSLMFLPSGPDAEGEMSLFDVATTPPTPVLRNGAHVTQGASRGLRESGVIYHY